VLHGIILLLIGRFGVQWVLGGGDDRFGPRGGGGGAGGAVHLVDLPAAAAPAAAAPVQQPAVHPPPQPDPAITLPPPTLKPLSMTVAPAIASAGTASDGTTGQGPGTGGGTGSGVGPGAGTDSGPGSGGDGAYILPYARTLLVPPKCVHGDFTLRFWVEVDGSVSKTSIEPPLKDGVCRREVLDKMNGFQFLPAKRDGRPVPAVFTIMMHQ
jgi:hypothetical protein